MKNNLPKGWATRTKIFQAALRLLNSHEIDEISIRGISKEAGISVGSFYYYYKTKFDVYYDAYTFMNDYFENTVIRNIPEGTSWEKLMFFFEQYNYYNVERTPLKLYKLLTIHASLSKMESYSYGLLRVLCQIIQSAQDNGEIPRRESPENVSIFLVNCIRGYYRFWILHEASFDISQTYKDFVAKLLSVYMTPPEGYTDYRIAEDVT